MLTPTAEYQAVPTEDAPFSLWPKNPDKSTSATPRAANAPFSLWPNNPDETTSTTADPDLVAADKDSVVAAEKAQAIKEIAAAPVHDTHIKEAFLFDLLRDFDWELSDTLEVKAVVPYGQAAVLGVVPGAWLNGVSAVGDEPTPVHSMAEYVELVDSFLGKGVYRGYIKTVRKPPQSSAPEVEEEEKQEKETKPAWNNVPPCLVAIHGLPEDFMHYKLLEGQTLMAERFDGPENSYVIFRGGYIHYVPRANATPFHATSPSSDSSLNGNITASKVLKAGSKNDKTKSAGAEDKAGLKEETKDEAEKALL